MTDIRDAVARALCDVTHAGADYGMTTDDVLDDPRGREYWFRLADAALSVARPRIEAEARERALREAADLAGDHATFYRELGQRAQEVGALGVRVAMRSLIDAPQQSPSQVSQTDEQAAKPSQPVDDVW